MLVQVYISREKACKSQVLTLVGVPVEHITICFNDAYNCLRGADNNICFNDAYRCPCGADSNLVLDSFQGFHCKREN